MPIVQMEKLRLGAVKSPGSGPSHGISFARPTPSPPPSPFFSWLQCISPREACSGHPRLQYTHWSTHSQHPVPGLGLAAVPVACMMPGPVSAPQGPSRQGPRLLAHPESAGSTAGAQ